MTVREHTKGSSEVIAYGFLVDESEQNSKPLNSFIQLFFTAADVRKAMACALPEVQVLICERPSEVSPLNLAAALHKDNPLRDIYLQKSDPNGLFVSRVETAGARGVINSSEAEQLLGLLPAPAEPPGALDAREQSSYPDELALLGYEEMQEPTFYPEEFDLPDADLAPPVVPTLQVRGPLDDLEWLEHVLELEDLDELLAHTTTAVAEMPPQTSSSPVAIKERETALNPAPDAEQNQHAVVAAFVSGRGGVGKSSLTVLTALELRRAGARVAMLDMDLQFGDLSVLAGNESENRITRVTFEELSRERIPFQYSDVALLLIEAPRNPALAEDLIQTVPRLLTSLRSSVDIVLINTSCLWNEAQAVLACNADKLVVCMDQRATSISAARQVVDLCVRLQIPSTKLEFLLNRCARNAPITDIDASLAMGGVEIITIAEGGGDVDELLSLGCPLELLSAQASLRQSVQELGARLIPDLKMQSRKRGKKR